MNIYLNIDGILFDDERHVANHADEFLQIILKKYPDSTYRLVSYAQKDEDTTKELLTPHLKPETIALLDKIKTSEWKDLKTEAIDFEHDFLWFDNELWPSELAILEKREAAECFIMVNLNKAPNALHELARAVSSQS